MEQEVKDTIKATFDEVTADSKAKVAELEAKVAKLEAVPIAPKGIAFIGSGEYKGYRLGKQMTQYKEAFGEEKGDFIAKCVIEMVEASKAGKKIDMKAAASQIEGTPANGGYFVIDDYADFIETLGRKASVMAPLMRQLNTVSDTFNVNKNLTECVITVDAEGAVTATSSTTGQIVIPVKRLSGRVSVSNELLADSRFDIASWLTEQFVYAYGQKIDTQILSGTGTGAGQMCSGVLTAKAGYSVILASSGLSSITADKISEAIALLATMDADKATFVCGRKGAHYIRTLKDTSNAPIYQAIAGPNLNTVYGIPSVIAGAISDATSVAGTAYAVVGNFNKAYMVNRLGNLEMFVDPYSDSASYDTAFNFFTRKGLGFSPDAFVRLVTYS